MSDLRKQRKKLLGTVTSRVGTKSVKVTVPYKIPHPLYGKIINRKTVLHAHDEKDETKPGDRVEIMETRPLSRLKRWRVTRLIDAAPEMDSVTPTEADVVAAVDGEETSEDSQS